MDIIRLFICEKRVQIFFNSHTQTMYVGILDAIALSEGVSLAVAARWFAAGSLSADKNFIFCTFVITDSGFSSRNCHEACTLENLTIIFLYLKLDMALIWLSLE